MYIYKTKIVKLFIKYIDKIKNTTTDAKKVKQFFIQNALWSTTWTTIVMCRGEYSVAILLVSSFYLTSLNGDK